MRVLAQRAAALLTVCLSLNARASIYDGYTGVRATAMGGAHEAVGTSNDTLGFNPAGMAQSRRFAADLQYAYAGRERLTRMSAMLVDSKSGPVAGGIGYLNLRGDGGGTNPNLHHFYMALAYPLSEQLALGVLGKNIRGHLDARDERASLSLYTADVGLMLSLGNFITAGATCHNAIESESHKEFTQRRYGFGLAFTSQSLVLTTDARLTPGDPEATRWSYHGGVEYFLQSVALRAGFQRLPFARTTGAPDQENIWSTGLGIVSQGGSIDVAYSRSLERSKNWNAVAVIKFFM